MAALPVALPSAKMREFTPWAMPARSGPTASATTEYIPVSAGREVVAGTCRTPAGTSSSTDMVAMRSDDPLAGARELKLADLNNRILTTTSPKVHPTAMNAVVGWGKWRGLAAA